MLSGTVHGFYILYYRGYLKERFPSFPQSVDLRDCYSIECSQNKHTLLTKVNLCQHKSHVIISNK